MCSNILNLAIALRGVPVLKIVSGGYGMRDDWLLFGDRKCISFHIHGITFSSMFES